MRRFTGAGSLVAVTGCQSSVVECLLSSTGIGFQNCNVSCVSYSLGDVCISV